MATSIRTLVENKLALILGDALSLISADQNTTIPVIAGDRGQDIPWEYVMVEVTESERKDQNVFTVEAGIQVMGTADRNSGIDRANQNFKIVSDYFAAGPNCPFYNFADNELKVYGFWVEGSQEIRGARTYGEQLNVIIACQQLS